MTSDRITYDDNGASLDEREGSRMSTCGAETDVVGGVVCDRAVDHDGPHQAAAWVPSYEYGAAEGETVLATVTWPQVPADGRCPYCSWVRDPTPGELDRIVPGERCEAHR